MPFTKNDFLNVFEEYNQTVFPFQIILFASAIYIIYLVIKRKKYSDKTIVGILLFYWIWIGIVYHILFFSKINPPAYIFGGVFIIQGFLLLKEGIIKPNLEFSFKNNFKTFTGLLFIFYALIIYPFIGYLIGHIYPEAPTFGLPCPTVIFTFGILLMIKNRFPLYLLIIPFLWSLLGFSAAVNFGINEDIGLLAAGLIGSALIVSSRLKLNRIKSA